MNETFDSLAALKKSCRWLTNYASDVYSQTGEDGVITKALEVLPTRNQWCVEFGAWDGKYLSNTFNLVKNHAYRVVLIEGDSEKHRSLCSDYPYKDRAVFVGQFVGWAEDDNLDTILQKTPTPIDFDLLSIDVDGNDYHIWKATKKFKPKLVLIEFNPTSSNRFEFVQPARADCNQSSSPASIVRLAQEKGYELVSVIGPNLLFVDRQYYSAFNIADNSLDVMRDEDEVNHLFLGFDGSLLVDGPARLRWHGLPLKIHQFFPKILTGYPPNYSTWRRFFFRIWKRFNQ